MIAQWFPFGESVAVMQGAGHLLSPVESGQPDCNMFGSRMLRLSGLQPHCCYTKMSHLMPAEAGGGGQSSVLLSLSFIHSILFRPRYVCLFIGFPWEHILIMPSLHRDIIRF